MTLWDVLDAYGRAARLIGLGLTVGSSPYDEQTGSNPVLDENCGFQSLGWMQPAYS